MRIQRKEILGKDTDMQVVDEQSLKGKKKLKAYLLTKKKVFGNH